MDKIEKRARALVKIGTAEKNRLRREGKKLIALVVRLRGKIQRDSYALGTALARLKDKTMLSVLGYKTFPALCNTALDLSSDLADDLIAIATNFSAAQAKHLGTSMAIALVDLSKALPGEHTAAGLLSRRTVRAGGRTIRVRGASSHEIVAQARALRAARPSATKHGVRLTRGERHLASALEHALFHRHVEASVRAVAGSKDRGGRLRMEFPMRAIADVDAALREVERLEA